MDLTIDNMMQASFGEVSSEIRASYKKTVLVKQYETEVIEMETTLKMDKPITGAERMFISAILQVQLEYTAYCQLAYKGLITSKQLSDRRGELENGINTIKAKAEAVLGKSLDNYIETAI